MKLALLMYALAVFGGYADFSKSHGLLVDMIVRVNRRNLRKNGLDTTKILDTRNWNKIGAWAHDLARILSKKQPTHGAALSELETGR